MKVVNGHVERSRNIVANCTIRQYSNSTSTPLSETLNMGKPVIHNFKNKYKLS